MQTRNTLLILFIVLWAGCTPTWGQHKKERLSVGEFSEKLALTDSAVIVDVRTPREFAGGHLPGAFNVDWNGDAFDSHIALLDKSAPVFVYCLSGGRSRSAMEKLHEAGFEQVFELEGGMTAWRHAALPEVSPGDPADSEGMSISDYHALLQSNDQVLVDFYAPWCVPCLKMKPYLDRIKADLGDRVAIVRINIDENRGISKELGVSALPVLMLYENQEQIWTHQGYLDEDSIRKQLR